LEIVFLQLDRFFRSNYYYPHDMYVCTLSSFNHLTSL
jgi:hypothetical protein